MLKALALMVVVLVGGSIVSPPAFAQQSSDEKEFRQFKDRNLVGGDYRKSKRGGTVDLEKCIKTCKEIPECKAYSYRSSEGVCYLKDTITQFEEDPSTTTGIITSLSAPPPPPCSDEAFQAAKDADTARGYSAFLDKCNSGERVAEIKIALKEAREDEAWQLARDTNTCGSFNNFLNNHASEGGQYVKEATARKNEKCQAIEREQEDEAWQTASSNNNCASYREFLGRYPSSSGQHYSQAQSKQEELCATSHFNILANRDMHGGDYKILKRLSLDDCQDICRNNTSCRAFTYDKWNRFCFLKSRIGTVRLEPKTITGVVSSEPAPNLANTRIQMDSYNGKRFPDTSYTTKTAYSTDRCEAICASDHRCVAYSFYRNENNCKLMDVADEYNSARGVDSGAKRQPARN